MPTGTGKSGVIATVCQCGRFDAISLILTPATMLRDQLAMDIEKRFWQRARISVPATSKPVKRVVPSDLGAQLQTKSGPKVLVATIQTLEQLARDDRKTYRELAARLEFVIVDEGHREPAPEWAHAVRGLGRPTILFSATP
jgi:superfamily II DNA or RNA helicase